MSLLYTTPTGLTGVPASLSIPLTWNPSSVISGGPSLLLHMDGTGGSTVFVDSSGNALVGTTSGTAQQSTTGAKFGAACGLFASSGGVRFPMVLGGPLDMQTGDYTVEGWFNLGGQAGGQSILFENKDSLNNSTISVFFNSVSSEITGSVDAQGIPSSANNFPQGVYHHLALVMASNAFTVYIDGVATSAPTPVARHTSLAGNFIISDNALPVSGRIDEFRVTKGIAVYTSNFTPPAVPFMGATPAGYDVYRNGVSVAQYLGAPGYTDAVPGVGIYTYNVAASDGISTDVSDLSAPFTVAIGQIGNIQGKFVPAPAYKAIMMANPGTINPRIYPPLEDNTVRVKP